MRNAASCLTTAVLSNDVCKFHWPALALGLLATFLFTPAVVHAERARLFPEAMLAPEEAEPEEGFGRAFAIDGDVAVVTANIGSFFSGTDPEDNGGAAYVFERDSSGVWHQSARLDPPYEGLFGHSVAIEGRTIVVGAPFAAAAFVFEDLGAGWVHTGTLTGSGDPGFSVAIDDGVIAVSTYSPNGLRLFRKATNGWTQIAALPGGGNYGGSDYRGPRVDIDGNRAIHHSPGDNFTEPEQPELVYIHTRPNGGDWSAATTAIIGPASINRHVAISGNVAVSGGVIREYTAANGWRIVGNNIALDVEASVDGDLVLGSSGIRQRNAAGEWPAAATLIQPDGRLLYASRLSGRRTIGVGRDHAAAFVHTIPADLERSPVQLDDFQDGNATGWVALGGSFAVVPTTYSSVYRQTNLTGNAAAVLSGAVGGNQTIQADIRPTAFSGADRWFGLVARYTDANNYYYVTARSTNVVQLKRLVNGVAQTLGSVPLTIQTNRHYRLRLETIDQRVRLLIDDRLVLDVRDTSLSQGQVGLMMYKTAADYDNLLWGENPQQSQFDKDFELSEEGIEDFIYPSPPPAGWAYATAGGSRLIAHSQTTGGSLMYNRASGANQSVSVDARATAFNGADRWFGVALRYIDDQNYYYLTVRNSNTVSLRKLANGTIHTLDTASFTVAANTWYRLRLENVGSTLRGYIDNQLIVEASDPAPIPQSQLQGSAIVLYKTAVQYDNWRVTQP